MRDRQGKRGCHRRIDGVAAIANHLEPDLRGDVALRHHHPPLGAKRRGACVQGEGGNDESDKQDKRAAGHGASAENYMPSGPAMAAGLLRVRRAGLRSRQQRLPTVLPSVRIEGGARLGVWTHP